MSEDMVARVAGAIRDDMRLLILASGVTLAEYERCQEGIVTAVATRALAAVAAADAGSSGS